MPITDSGARRSPNHATYLQIQMHSNNNNNNNNNKRRMTAIVIDLDDDYDEYHDNTDFL
jgi:hypothetical protein